MSAATVTVKDVWRAALPAGTELIAGGSGLERRVEWACALRTRPPAFEAVKGGEVAFVSVGSIHLLDERLDLAQVMSSFAEKGGVAVVALGDVSTTSIDLADRLVMPLLRLPDGVHLSDAHQACVRFILDQRTLLHERAQDLQTSLMQLALSGAGTAGIVDRLGEITSLPALWLDAEGSVRHVHGGSAADLEAALREQLAGLLRWADSTVVAAADPPVRELALGAPDSGALASPIATRHGVGGFLAVVGADAELNQLRRLAVSRAASACAIELDRELAVVATQQRLEGEFIAALLRGTYASEADAVERAHRLGFELQRELTVFSVRSDRAAGAEWAETGLRAARTLLERRGVVALLTAHEGALCGVVGGGADGDGLDLGRHVEALRGEIGPRGDASAGIGRPGRGAPAVRGSHREAEQALALGRRVLGRGRTVHFADLGLHRLLLSMAQHQELSDFYTQTVGALLAYDTRTRGELMPTLDAFFATHGSPTETAQRLGLHRNTVLYRLRRIQEVGRLDLDDPATRLNLHLCLRVRDVLGADDSALH